MNGDIVGAGALPLCIGNCKGIGLAAGEHYGLGVLCIWIRYFVSWFPMEIERTRAALSAKCRHAAVGNGLIRTGVGYRLGVDLNGLCLRAGTGAVTAVYGKRHVMATWGCELERGILLV